MPAKIHELKVWPEYFTALLDGRKTFELRKDDRGFGVGHVLDLREFSPGDETYTGRSVRKKISYISYGDNADTNRWGLQPGFAILGLTD